VVKGSISQDPRSPRHGQLPASSTTRPPPPRRGRTARGPPGSSKARPHKSVGGIKAQLTEPPSPASPHRPAAAQRGQPACHGILCRSRAPVQRDAPPQDATEQASTTAASARRSDAEHHRGSWEAPGPRPAAPALFPLAPPRERGEDRANGMRRAVATLRVRSLYPDWGRPQSPGQGRQDARHSVSAPVHRGPRRDRTRPAHSRHADLLVQLGPAAQGDRQAADDGVVQGPWAHHPLPRAEAA
jgi:hypothetical protein